MDGVDLTVDLTWLRLDAAAARHAELACLLSPGFAAAVCAAS